MHVHFVAVAGTGMGSLAGLFKAAGHDVSGSDTAFYPPMGPALRRWGIRLFEGFDPAHLSPAPDLVVVGNVCRPWNEQARAAIDGGLAVTTMVDALADHVLPGTAPLVVGGTHGKTTTSAMCAWVLDQAGLAPGFLIGGLPKNFEESYRLPGRGPGDDGGLNPPGRPRRATPFVIEGDEYDTAFFEKTPKFWHYRPEVAIITSIEHDHIDIYPDEASYQAAFRGFVERVPATGLIVAHAGDPAVVDAVASHAQAPVVWYGLEGDDPGSVGTTWRATAGPPERGRQTFDVHRRGEHLGRATLDLSGAHNLRNAVACLAAACEGYDVGWPQAQAALASFEGVRRRQDRIGEPRGICVYDDFAHHPTAVRETLAGLRARHPEGQLWAVYEPRSATACRRLHQDSYSLAFDAADQVVMAPLGRTNIPEEERLDVAALATALAQRAIVTHLPDSVDDIVTLLRKHAHPGDVIALLSNGSFGGIHDKLLAALAD